MKATYTEQSSGIVELERVITPTAFVNSALKCHNCGVNRVQEQGEWCWECIKDRESLD